MRLNERRQAQAVADLADERQSIGSGVMAYMEGTAWMCKAVAADLERPLTDEDFGSITEYYRSRGVPPTLELTACSHEETLAAAARAGLFLLEAEHVLSRAPADLDDRAGGWGVAGARARPLGNDGPAGVSPPGDPAGLDRAPPPGRPRAGMRDRDHREHAGPTPRERSPRGRRNSLMPHGSV